MNFILQTWFNNQRIKLGIPSTKDKFCRNCQNYYSWLPHESYCIRFYSTVKNNNTCFCGKMFEAIDSIYSHLMKKKCDENVQNNLDDPNNYGFENEIQKQEVQKEQIQISVKTESVEELPEDESNLKISGTEGNSAHYSSTTNDNMEPAHDNSVTPNGNTSHEDENPLDFLKSLDFSDLQINLGNRNLGVHKVFLAKSPIFRQLIIKNEEIKIEEEDYQAAIEALRYLYKDINPRYEVLSFVDALIGGTMFQIKGLRKLSEEYLKNIQLGAQ